MGVESIYRRFLGIVAQARGKTPSQVDQIAQGRVWAGGTARQLGLVDSFGGMDEAIARAAGLAKLGNERGVTYLERPKSWRGEFASLFDGGDDGGSGDEVDGFAALGAGDRGEIAAALGTARQLLDGPTVQVRCLECGSAGSPTRVSPADSSFLRGLLALLTE